MAHAIDGTSNMLSTGNQLKAARALAGMDQVELAKRAKISVTTVSNMEGVAGDILRSSFETVRAVQQALESAGIEFTNGDSPGVRLKAKS